MHALILNRDAQLPTDGWYQFIPKGEHPHAASGLVQVIDDAACIAIVNSVKALASNPSFAGLLVDRDHNSLDAGKSTEAIGWIRNMEVRADGVWAQIDWTDEGAKAVAGKRYKFLSPVFSRAECEDLGNGRVRPMTVKNAAVTNDPNIKTMLPMTNATTKGGSTMDKQILEALGLDDTATIETVLAAIDALKTKPAADGSGEDMGNGCAKGKVPNAAPLTAAEVVMKNRAEAAERALLEIQVEKDLVQFAPYITNRDAVKARLLADRAGTIATFEALLSDRMPNRADGSAPEINAADKATARASAISDLANRTGCGLAVAYSRIRESNPELFV